MAIRPPVIDLSRHFPYSQILAVAGIGVKGYVPEIEQCPFCRGKTLSVYPTAGHNTPGYWMRCSHCEWSGDTLEAYGKIRKIKDLYEAARAAIGEGLTEVPSQCLSDWAVSSYVREYPGRRARTREIWAKLKDNLMGELSPVMLQRVQSENLWGGWATRTHRNLCQYIGGGTSTEVNDIFDTVIPVLPKEGYTSVLAIGYQDLPGRICAYHLCGPKDSKWWYANSREVRDNVDDEGGLAMLESLSASETTVLAVGDAHLALQLHRLNFIDNDIPLKLVAFNANTKHAWAAVNAQKVILWNNEIDWRLFDHARRVANGHVYMGMHYAEGAYTYIRNKSVYEVTVKMEREAMPWPAAFAKWILDRNVNEFEKREAVTSLCLSMRDQERVFEECKSDAQRNAVKRYLSEIKITKSVVMNAKSIVEKHGGWWVQLPKSLEERISDAIIRIEREVNDPAQGTTYLYGYVLFRNTKVPFCVNKTDIAVSTKTWVEKHVATAGLGLPTINHRWDKSLFTLAKNFSEPTVGVCYASYGIQPSTGEIVMPRFKLTKKEVVKDDFYIASKSVPGLAVSQPHGRTIRPTDRNFPARSAWISCAAMLVTNWLRFYQGAAPVPVLAIGSPGSIAHAAATAFARGMAMPVFTLGDAKRRTVEDLRAGLNGYNYPSLVQTRSARLLLNYPAKNTDFVYFCADKLEGAALKAGGKWWTIEAPEPNLDPDVLPPIDDVFMYLRDLQKRDFAVPQEPFTLEFVAKDMCEWYGRYLNVSSNDTLDGVLEYIEPRYSYVDAFLNLLFTLQHNGQVSIEHASAAEAVKRPKVTALIIDDAANEVYMHRSRLNTALRNMDLPAIDLLHIQEDAERFNIAVDKPEMRDGLTIPIDYWHKRLDVWRSVNL